MTIKIQFTLGKRAFLEHISSQNQGNTQRRQEVFPVHFRIDDEKGQVKQLSAHLSVMPKALQQAFYRWREYISLDGQNNTNRFRKIRIEPQKDLKLSLGNASDNAINFQALANQFKIELNQWLNQEGWLTEDGERESKIITALQAYSQTLESSNQEVQIFIETEDRDLRDLPWQEWELFHSHYSHAEVAISATDYQRPLQQQSSQLKASVRVLAVFGDQALGLEAENTLIKNLEKYGGDVKILQQPTQKELEQTLQDKEGWHIFFFAGHSESDDQRRMGRIEIRPGEIIEIEDLGEFLKALIHNKLQLVIFNSCNGLGLANQLTNLSLPYCIVMREPVESEVAHSLLKHFLESFVKGQSLFSAVNYAREKLSQEFDLIEGGHPGKSWLPIIVANPLAKPLSWNSLFLERRLSLRWEILLCIVSLLIVLALPFSILLEFENLDTLIFYAKLYPHLIVYPSLFLWISIYCLYRTLCLVRQKTSFLIGLTITSAILTATCLFLELKTDPMMLFELKKYASIEINNPFINISHSSLMATSKSLVQANTESSSIIQDNQNLLNLGLSYKTWHGNTDQLSISQRAYALVYFAILFCGMEIYTLLLSFLKSPESVFNKHKYLIYIFMYELSISAWMPFNAYYKDKIKNILFGTSHNPSLANFNSFVYLFIVISLFLNLLAMDQLKKLLYKALLSFYTISMVIFTFLSNPNGITVIDQLFGLRSSFTPWVFAFLFFPFLIIPIFRLIDLNAKEN